MRSLTKNYRTRTKSSVYSFYVKTIFGWLFPLLRNTTNVNVQEMIRTKCIKIRFIANLYILIILVLFDSFKFGEEGRKHSDYIFTAWVLIYYVANVSHKELKQPKKLTGNRK